MANDKGSKSIAESKKSATSWLIWGVLTAVLAITGTLLATGSVKLSSSAAGPGPGNPPVPEENIRPTLSPTIGPVPPADPLEISFTRSIDSDYPNTYNITATANRPSRWKVSLRDNNDFNSVPCDNPIDANAPYTTTHTFKTKDIGSYRDLSDYRLDGTNLAFRNTFVCFMALDDNKAYAIKAHKLYFVDSLPTIDFIGGGADGSILATTPFPAQWNVARIDKDAVCDHARDHEVWYAGNESVTTQTSHDLYDDSTAAYGQRKVCWRLYQHGGPTIDGRRVAVPSYTIRTTPEPSSPTQQQLNNDCIFPTNWGDLTDEEKVEANPCGCSLPELIRVDSGHCLIDITDIKRMEIEMYITADKTKIWAWTYSGYIGDEFNVRGQSIQWYMVPSRDSNIDCQTNAAAVVEANKGTTQTPNEVYEYVIERGFDSDSLKNNQLEKIKLCFYAKSKSGEILSDEILINVPTAIRDQIFAD